VDSVPAKEHTCTRWISLNKTVVLGEQAITSWSESEETEKKVVRRKKPSKEGDA